MRLEWATMVRSQLRWSPPLRSFLFTALALAFSASTAWAQLPSSCTSFTDDPLAAGVTVIKAVHLTQLRTCIDDLRAQRSLGSFPWTDPTVTAQVTVVKAVHITELRTALNAVYTASGLSLPNYSAAPVAGVTTIQATYFTEIRNAIASVTGGGTPCQLDFDPDSHHAIEPAAGGSDTIYLNVHCAWQAVSSASWLTVSPASGVPGFSQPLQISFAQNSAAQRTAFIDIQGVKFYVTQASGNGPSPDLIVNGDFDLGFQDISYADATGRLANGWDVGGDPENPLMVSEGGIIGDKEQKIDGFGGLLRLVAMPPNVTYELTADVFVTSGGAALFLGSPPGVGAVKVESTRLGAQRLRLLFSHSTPYAPYNTLVHVVTTEPGSQISVDHISLRPAGDVLTDEAVVNGSFEDGFHPISDANGSGDLGNGWTHLGQSTPPQGFFNPGGYSWNLWQGVEGGSFGTGLQQVVTLQANQKYLVHANVWMGTGGMKFVIGPSGGVEYEQVYLCGGGQLEWHELQAIFTPPFTGQYTVAAKSLFAQSDYLVDDISITPTALSFVQASTAGTGTECIQMQNLTFAVHDAVTQDPVEGATVAIAPSYGSGPPRFTYPDGTISYMVGEGPLQFTVTKSGYVTNAGTINVGSAGTHAISLMPEGGGGPPGCSVSLSPSSITLGSSAYSGSFSVFAPANCSWSAVSDQSFLTIISGTNGTGNGIVTYQISSNDDWGIDRSATIRVNGVSYSVLQRSEPTDIIGFDVDADIRWNPAANKLQFFGSTRNDLVRDGYVQYWNGQLCDCYFASFVDVELGLQAPDGSISSYYQWAAIMAQSGPYSLSQPMAGQWVLLRRHRKWTDLYERVVNPEHPNEEYYQYKETSSDADIRLLNFAVVQPITARLTLFLDVDGNFDPNNPRSDDPTYVPGSNPATGGSVALPQQVRLIAAYVGPNGTVVPYGPNSDAEFRLLDTSAFAGIAMNVGTDPFPDYSFSSVNPLVQQNTAAWRNTTVRDASVVNLYALDYGGITRVQVTHGTETTEIRLPQDADLNALPDRGWAVPGASQLVPYGGNSWDDFDPGAGPDVGDGLNAFEEYRGFFVGGVHTRTRPAARDFFVDSVYGVGDARNSGMTIHEILSSEYSADNYINFNYQNHGNPVAGYDQTRHYNQKGARIVEGGFSTAGARMFPFTTLQQLPSFWTHTEIYSKTLRQASPPRNNQNDPDQPIDTEKLQQTLAHEIGHWVFLPDVAAPRTIPGDLNSPAVCPLPAANVTVMITEYFQQSTGNDVWSCHWLSPNIPHHYQLSDLQQIRLR